MAAYCFTNSKGTKYYLYQRKNVQLRGGQKQDIYFFSKESDRNLGPEEVAVTEVPADRKVEESTRNGFVYLKKK